MNKLPLFHGLRVLLPACLFLISEHVAFSQEAPIVPPRKGRNLNLNLISDDALTGWVGDRDRWILEDGELIGRTSGSSDDPVSLYTETEFSDFRLLLDFKRIAGSAPANIAFWGTPTNEQGHVVRLAPDVVLGVRSGDVAEVSTEINEPEFIDEWNRVELLAQGNRIRVVVNSKLVLDWRNADEGRVLEGPIALELSGGEESQEVRFRNLRLETFPQERLTTLPADQQEAAEGSGIPERNVGDEVADLWTRLREVVIPEELLKDFFHPRHGLKHFGIRAEERDAFFAILQKARELDQATLKKAANGFRKQRQKEALGGKYADQPTFEFPVFVDLYKDPELYHGKLVTLNGHIRKLIRVPAGDNPYGIDEYWEAWLFDQHGQSNPAVIIALEYDERLEPGTEIVVDHVSATGYFIKNYGFEGQDAMRFAPAFVAKKIEYHEPVKALNPFDLDLSAKMQLLVASVVILMFGRFAYRHWKKSKVEDAQREAVRSIVSTDDAEPTFDNIVDNGGVPQFPED